MSGARDKKTAKEKQSVEDTVTENPKDPAEVTSEVPEESSGEQPVQEAGEKTGESEEEVTDKDGVEVLLEELEVQKKLVAEHRDKALRAQAELENLRKRTHREMENAHKYALEKFVNELLPVLDSMELGIAASDTAEDIESLKEGLDLTLKKFSSILEKFGVRTIDPQGEKFNPELHEAVTMQEQEGMAQGSVISVMQKGYELNGRLIRPAMVIVAK